MCGLMTSLIFSVIREFVILCSAESEHFMHYVSICVSVCLSVCLSVCHFSCDCLVWQINVYIYIIVHYINKYIPTSFGTRRHRCEHVIWGRGGV